MKQEGVTPLGQPPAQNTQVKALELGGEIAPSAVQEPPRKPPHAKRIKRNQQNVTRDFIPDIKLDLHGLYVDEAEAALQAFFADAVRAKADHGLVITGKGLHSKDQQGKLRQHVWDLLCGRPDPRVASFDWSPPWLGGRGAILIFFHNLR